MDERATGASSARATRVGLSGQTGGQTAQAASAACAGGRGRTRRIQKKIGPLLGEVATAFPHAQVELWATDEHRIGLKPILHKIWCFDGKRPLAPVQHRYEWRYLVGFVHPASGRTVFH